MSENTAGKRRSNGSYTPKHHRNDKTERNGQLMLTEEETQLALAWMLKTFRTISGATDCVSNIPAQRIVIEFNYPTVDVKAGEW